MTLIVVFGKRKWNWPRSTSPRGSNSPAGRSRSGPYWLENHAAVSSRYASGETSTTLREPGMRDLAVVALEVVLAADLPVRLVLAFGRGAGTAGPSTSMPPAASSVGSAPEDVRQRRRVPVGVDEDERPPRGRPAVGARRDARRCRSPAHGRRAGAERSDAVEVVRPRVVRALQRLAPTLALADERASMAADVEERAQLGRRGRGRRAPGRRRRESRRTAGLRDLIDRARRTASSGGRRLPARPPARPGRRTSSTGRSATTSRLPCRERSRSHRAVPGLHQRPSAVAEEPERDGGEQEGPERRLRQPEQCAVDADRLVRVVRPTPPRRGSRRSRAKTRARPA